MCLLLLVGDIWSLSPRSMKTVALFVEGLKIGAMFGKLSESLGEGVASLMQLGADVAEAKRPTPSSARVSASPAPPEHIGWHQAGFVANEIDAHQDSRGTCSALLRAAATLIRPR